MIYKIIIIVLLIVIIILYKQDGPKNIEKYENIEEELENIKDEIYKWKIYGIGMSGCCNYNKEKSMCGKIKEEEECNITYEKILPDINKNKKSNEKIYNNALKLYEKEYKYYKKQNENNILGCEDYKNSCIENYEKEYCNNNYMKISECGKNYIKRGDCEKNGYIKEDKCEEKGYITKDKCEREKNKIENANIQGCIDNNYMLITDCN